MNALESMRLARSKIQQKKHLKNQLITDGDLEDIFYQLTLTFHWNRIVTMPERQELIKLLKVIVEQLEEKYTEKK